MPVEWDLGTSRKGLVSPELGAILISNMHQALRITRDVSVVLISLPLGGCTLRGAPSFTLFGAFFPAWMFCGTLGIFAAIGVRVLFVATGWSTVLPYQLFLCTSIGLIAGLLAWLLWFGP